MVVRYDSPDSTESRTNSGRLLYSGIMSGPLVAAEHMLPVMFKTPFCDMDHRRGNTLSKSARPARLVRYSRHDLADYFCRKGSDLLPKLNLRNYSMF